MKRYSSSDVTVYVPITIIEKTRGILFQEDLLNNGCMLFTHCNWVHSFFLKNPIKLYFLDRSLGVVRIVADFSPNRLSPIVFNASYTVETAIDFDLLHIENFPSHFKQALRT
ncbi:MAG: DUF192 domain-containing protein [bacterium]|nr:DUF192 domain-containing protein [bacterium]